jgi:hypothetical protein
VLYPLPEEEPVSQKELLTWEKELAGTYLSNHPIQRYLADIKAAKTTLLGELGDVKGDQPVMVAGLINFVRPYQTKKGDPMAFVEIEDIQGTCEVVVFPRVYTAHKHLLAEGKLIVVKGRVDAKGGSPKILADTISTELTIVGSAPPQPEPALSSEPLPLFNGNGSSSNNPLPSSTPKSNGHTTQVNHTRLTETSASYQSAPTPTSQPASALPSLTPGLHVTLPGTGNLAKDKHRLREMFRLLTRHSGRDPFSIYIPTEGRLIQIDFPNHATHYSPELKQKLVLLFEAEVRWVQSGN